MFLERLDSIAESLTYQAQIPEFARALVPLAVAEEPGRRYMSSAQELYPPA